MPWDEPEDSIHYYEPWDGPLHDELSEDYTDFLGGDYEYSEGDPWHAPTQSSEDVNDWSSFFDEADEFDDYEQEWEW